MDLAQVDEVKASLTGYWFAEVVLEVFQTVGVLGQCLYDAEQRRRDIGIGKRKNLGELLEDMLDCGAPLVGTDDLWRVGISLPLLLHMLIGGADSGPGLLELESDLIDLTLQRTQSGVELPICLLQPVNLPTSAVDTIKLRLILVATGSHPLKLLGKLIVGIGKLRNLSTWCLELGKLSSETGLLFNESVLLIGQLFNPPTRTTQLLELMLRGTVLIDCDVEFIPKGISLIGQGLDRSLRSLQSLKLAQSRAALIGDSLDAFQELATEGFASMEVLSEAGVEILDRHFDWFECLLDDWTTW